MFESTRIADRFVAHPRALGARDRFSACTQTYGSGYEGVNAAPVALRTLRQFRKFIGACST
jgi:hypothetical protein